MKNLFLITLAILFSFQTTFAQSGRTAGGVVWDLLPGGGYAKQITSEANGNLWVIGMDNTIFSYNGSSWVQCPNGAGLDVAAYNGVPYVIGMDNQIYKGNGSGFDLVPGGGYGKRVAIDATTSKLFVIGMDDSVFELKNNIWTRVGSGYGLDITANRTKIAVVGLDSQLFRTR